MNLVHQHLYIHNNTPHSPVTKNIHMFCTCLHYLVSVFGTWKWGCSLLSVGSPYERLWCRSPHPAVVINDIPVCVNNPPGQHGYHLNALSPPHKRSFHYSSSGQAKGDNIDAKTLHSLYSCSCSSTGEVAKENDGDRESVPIQPGGTLSVMEWERERERRRGRR